MKNELSEKQLKRMAEIEANPEMLENQLNGIIEVTTRIEIEYPGFTQQLLVDLVNIMLKKNISSPYN